MLYEQWCDLGLIPSWYSTAIKYDFKVKLIIDHHEKTFNITNWNGTPLGCLWEVWGTFKDFDAAKKVVACLVLQGATYSGNNQQAFKEK